MKINIVSSVRFVKNKRSDCACPLCNGSNSEDYRRENKKRYDRKCRSPTDNPDDDRYSKKDALKRIRLKKSNVAVATHSAGIAVIKIARRRRTSSH